MAVITFIIFFIALIGFLGSLAVLLINLFRRKKRKKSAIASLVLLIVVIAFGVRFNTMHNNGQAPDLKDGKMTMEKFEECKTGMTKSQVDNIVGADGKLESESTIAGTKAEIYTYKGYGDLGSNAQMTFENGKLQSKAQAGLK